VHLDYFHSNGVFARNGSHCRVSVWLIHYGE
jgi:hypothetical protein